MNTNAESVVTNFESEYAEFEELMRKMRQNPQARLCNIFSHLSHKCKETSPETSQLLAQYGEELAKDPHYSV